MSVAVPNEFPRFESEDRIAFVGEAPGAEEEQQGKPFVGASGYLLNKICQSVNILRPACFVGNVYQYRPPGNKIEKVNHQSAEWVTSKAKLLDDLRKFDPNIVVCLGKTPLEEVLGLKGISKWRGSLSPACTGHKGLATFHPAFVLRQYELFPILEADLRKAKQESASPNLVRPARTYFLNPSVEQVITYLRECEQAKYISLDFETLRGNGLPICLGIAPSEKQAICVPFGEPRPVAEEARIWQAIAHLMDSPVPKVFHNALFDLSVIAVWCRVFPRNVWMDTMLAWHACYPEFRKSLAFVASIMTTQPYWKHMGKGEDEADDPEEEKAWSVKTKVQDLWEYNCIDACVTHEIAGKLWKEMEELGATKAFETDMKSIVPALYMMLRGTRIDEVEMQKGLLVLKEQEVAIQKLIKLAFGREVNTKSDDDVKAAFKERGFPIQYTGRGEERRATTDVDALLNLVKLGYADALHILRNRMVRTKQGFFYRKEDGSLRTTGKTKTPILGKDGRFHAAFNVAGTKTGRWSSSPSILGGRNQMNIPNSCRGHYIADPGYVLVGWDKAQAEARVVAYQSWLVSGDDSYKKIVESGQKIHVWFGHRLAEVKVFKCKPEEVVSGRVEYDIAKQSVHAFSYGEGAEKFIKQLAKKTLGEIVVPLWQAKSIQATLFESIPAITAWQAAIREWLNEHKILTTAFGRIGLFWERWGDDLWRKYYAFGPQATVGDDVARSIVDCYEKIPQFQPLQQNYDSLLGQCKEGDVDQVLKMMKPLAEQPIHLSNFSGTKSCDLIIPVVMKVGPNWRDMKELK